MIKKLKMVNWKSHASTEITFSPGTNLLIGTMGSGKTSCLEAICFAFFGSFPSLKSRQVNLAEVVMSLPDKKTNALVEVVFTANNREYVVTRTVSTRGTEAFLRGEGALLEGPQPIRTTEAVSRLLKINYETFTRVVYGEQNKIDYLLTLAKGPRKTQVDDLLGISLFEKARASSSTLISKLRSEKTSLETFLAGIDVENLETELSQLRASLQIAIERKNSLESSAFALSNDLENTRKNLESLEELKQINENLSLQLVKTQTEADSLHSSAVSLMPSALSSLSREQCTSMLEEYARAMQERSDLEREVNGLSINIQRLEGEAGVMRSILETLSLQKIEEEIKRLSGYSQQLELANKEYVELAKKEGALRSTLASLESELSAISKQEEVLLSKTLSLIELQRRFSSLQKLEEELKQKRSELSGFEKRIASKQEMLSSLEKIVSLLQREDHKCPTCDQAIGEVELAELTQLKKNELERSAAELASVVIGLGEVSKAVALLDLHLAQWVELLPFASKLQDVQERKNSLAASLQKTSNNLESVSQLVSASSNNVSHLRSQVEQLGILRDKKVQAEKSADRLEQLDKQLSVLKTELAKKNTALSTLEERKKIEERLNEARSALKAFDMFEKTEELKKKSRDLRDKLSNLQFSENDLKTFREKTSSLVTKVESNRVSLEHVNG
ncbi:SMC family ATPase, partial [Candidatus Micrarchaeota archaeon]|nr:SMC family ATPase [Candidatus Micrarchaeota archaeon]